jgi:hypothetical protein
VGRRKRRRKSWWGEGFSTVLFFHSQGMACYVAVDDDGHGDYSDLSVQQRGVDEGSAPPGEHRWLYGEEDGQDYDDDDEGDGHGHWILPPAEQEALASDLNDDAYLDPLALVNAWEGALLELKVRRRPLPL